MRWTALPSYCGLMLLALSLTACGASGEQQVTKMTEVVVKAAVSNQGQRALAAAGVEVSGPLSCTASPSGDQFSVSCSGTSLDGQQVTVTGTATSTPGGTSVAGTFVGMSGGRQVFATDCLGDC